MQTCIWPSWCHCHSLPLASVKSRLVLPFWYRLTQVVPEKGPLNGCVCVCYITYSHITSRQGSDTPLSSITTLPHSPLPSHPHSWLPSSPSTHTPFNGPFFGTTQVSRYQKGKTNLDFTGARDSDWQWHQLGRMQVCTSLQTDNHASTPPLSFLQAGCPSYRPTNSIKALKAHQSMEGSTPSTYVYNTPTQLLYRPTLYRATLQPATTSKTKS